MARAGSGRSTRIRGEARGPRKGTFSLSRGRSRRRSSGHIYDMPFTVQSAQITESGPAQGNAEMLLVSASFFGPACTGGAALRGTGT